MDVLFDVFRIPQPEWTDNFLQALASVGMYRTQTIQETWYQFKKPCLFAAKNFLFVDPSEKHESWRLTEGFVAEEGKALLSHLAKTRPNLVENHMSLLLAAFISAGVIEVICCSRCVSFHELTRIMIFVVNACTWVLSVCNSGCVAGVGGGYHFQWRFPFHSSHNSVGWNSTSGRCQVLSVFKQSDCWCSNWESPKRCCWEIWLVFQTNALVPPETSHISHCLPTLIAMATSTKPSHEKK